MLCCVVLCCVVLCCVVLCCVVLCCVVLCCGVVWCGVVWCGVVWCGVVLLPEWHWQPQKRMSFALSANNFFMSATTPEKSAGDAAVRDPFQVTRISTNTLRQRVSQRNGSVRKDTARCSVHSTLHRLKGGFLSCLLDLKVSFDT